MRTDSAPANIPVNHRGYVTLPGSGRTIWWTGRVAIGLRHSAPRQHEAVAESALWVQDLLLKNRH